MSKEFYTLIKNFLKDNPTAFDGRKVTAKEIKRYCQVVEKLLVGVAQQFDPPPHRIEVAACQGQELVIRIRPQADTDLARFITELYGSRLSHIEFENFEED